MQDFSATSKKKVFRQQQMMSSSQILIMSSDMSTGMITIIHTLTWKGVF
jgi:hypothetical protein